MRLSGRTAVEAALTAVGERLAHANEPCSIVVLGGAAMNLLGIVDRPTIDVDVLARADDAGALRPPDPLPETLQRAITAVARDQGLLENWVNTAVADQWAAEWVRAQDPSPEFQAVVGKVVAHVQDALR